MDETASTDLCPGCGASVATGARYCSGCGKPLGSTGPSQTAAKPKWYYNTWVILLSLAFVLQVFGLPLVWKHPTFSRRTKWLLTVATTVWTVVWVVIIWDSTMKVFKSTLDQMQQLNALYQ